MWVFSEMSDEKATEKLGNRRTNSETEDSRVKQQLKTSILNTMNGPQSRNNC